MSQPYNGFNVRSAPGAAGGYSQQQGAYTSQGTGYQDFVQQNPKSFEKDENVRQSTAGRHLIFALIEIGVGLLSNLGQMVTTFFSFIQIQVGIQDKTLQNAGLGPVLAYHPAFFWVSLVIAVGSQVLLQAGCQILSHSWKKEKKQEHLANVEKSKLHGVVEVLLSQEAGWFFTGLGFVLDAVGDLGFAVAFNVPWYVCIIFGLLMNGLSTYVLYDGDERFHYSYPVWWVTQEAKKVWRQAALERARLMQGVSRDGRALVQR